MAKSSRASTVKANNVRLKRKVFGPVEAARLERISKKLLQIAAQPKPQSDAKMKIVNGEEETEAKAEEDKPEAGNDDAAMEVDSNSKSSGSHSQSQTGRVEKRRKTSKIVFPSYKDRLAKKKRKN